MSSITPKNITVNYKFKEPKCAASGAQIDMIASGCLHAPYHHEFSVNKLIDYAKSITKKNSSPVLVLNGDNVTLDSVSRFASGNPVTVAQELTVLSEIFDKLSPVFSQIIVLEGNHENRLNKYFVRQTNGLLCGTAKMLDLLELICTTRLAVGKDGNLIENGTRPKGRFIHPKGGLYNTIILGDVVIAHVDRGGTQLGSTARAFEKWAHDIGIKYSMAIVNHNHRVFKHYTKDHLPVFEAGCLCDVQNYARRKYYGSQQTGFVHFKMVKTSKGYLYVPDSAIEKEIGRFIIE